MTRSDWTPGPLPTGMTPEVVQRLTTDPGVDLPTRTRVALGLSGLTAIEVHALDIRNVSMNGNEALTIIVVPNRDGRRADYGPTRRQTITEHARFFLGCHLSERRSRCSHHRMLMRSWTDDKGLDRCANCNEPRDFLSLPLFDSRESDRMSVSAIREEFRRLREMFGLDRSVTFDSLRDVHIANLLGGGGPGKRTA